MACDGRFSGSPGQMCRLHLDAYDHLTGQIAKLDALVFEAAAPFERLIPGWSPSPASGAVPLVIIAETGGDMARFATSARLAAWAGLAPGDQRVGRQAEEGPDPQGRPAPAPPWSSQPGPPPPPPPGRAPGSATLPAGSARATRRRPRSPSRTPCCASPGRSCATTATTRDGGTDYYERRDQSNREHLVRYHQQAQARLGLQVILTKPSDGSPPPAPATRSPPLSAWPGRLTVTAPHRRATQSALPRAWLGSPVS